MNDNAPVFVSDIINIEINENTRSAYSLDNQMAYDPDIGKISKNSIFYQNVKNTQKESKILKTPVKRSFEGQNSTLYILPNLSQQVENGTFDSISPDFDPNMTPDMALDMI